MFSLISSPRPGGAEHSGSSGSAAIRGFVQVIACKFALVAIGLAVSLGLAGGAISKSARQGITRADADQCRIKLNSMEYFAGHRKAGQKQATRFSENEVNAYLALDLSSKYHPSLKSLDVKFEEDRLSGVANIDFDRLGATSTKLLPKLLSFMLSGVHALTVHGQLISGNGQAYFRLEQARFDNVTLPKALVEEIITAVGRKQNPPFDPMKPSKTFYGIDKVEVHAGFIQVYQ